MRSNILNQIFSVVISTHLITLPLSATDIITDGSTNTTIEKSRNQTTVVNIANPNSKGLSHNRYDKFDVGKSGVILNNSTGHTNTSLGGWIYGNANLNKSAKVILNEITSTNRSVLNGYVEVGGKQADIVIANPNGISINGAGFINSVKVTLSTGTPVLKDGAIDSYVNFKHDITVGQDGLNVNDVDIYTSYLRLNGAINAANLDVNLQGDGTNGLLLDSSALGGMYANKIVLVGSSQGLGVNLPPEVLASSGDITITNDGKIVLNDMSASGDIDITSTSTITNQSTTQAKKDINLKAQTIYNTGTVLSNSDTSISTGSLTNKGDIVSNRNFIDTDSLTNDGTIQTTESLNLKANNLTIKARDKATVSGSNLSANDGDIQADSIDIGSSQDTHQSQTTKGTLHATTTIDLYGGTDTDMQYDGSMTQTSATQVSHNNSQLNFNNLTTTSAKDTVINGATVWATDSLQVDAGKELKISSVQDTSSNSSQTVSVGTSNQSASIHKDSSTQTVVTSLKGGAVAINTQGNTDLSGATVSSTNDDLTLNTGTLTHSDLSNRKISKTIGIGASSNSGSIGYNTQNSKTKTLSTIGAGTINIKDQTNSSDTTKLNRDTDNSKIDIYAVKRDVSVSAQVDTNLLTEQGRKKIKDDIITSSAITNAIEQIATTDKANVLNFFKETDKNVKVYEGIKKELAKNPQLAKQLQNPNLTPQQKQDMLQTIANTVKKSLGYDTAQDDVKIVSTTQTGANNQEFKGHYANNDKTYINDKNNQDTDDLISTIAHETQHNIDDQDNKHIPQDQDQNDYADNFGDDVSFYTSNALDYTHDGTMAQTNNHIAPQSIQEYAMVSRNSMQFGGLDKDKGDNAIYLYADKVVATDGVNDGKVIDLIGKEAYGLGLKKNILRNTIKIVDKQDIDKFESVFNLNNKDDFETLQDKTDMNYHDINTKTDIVFWNGMDNTELEAQQSQKLIQGGNPNKNVGLINNETGGYIDDFFEWKPNYLTTKDVLNSYVLQQLSPNTHVITHSAGNEDIYKANRASALVNAKTPYIHTSVGSPTSEAKLRSSGEAVGVTFNRQINHENDPVANGWVNKGANYEIDWKQKIPIYDDLINNHPFGNYYNNEGVKEKIKETLNNEQ